jgi:argininosuccinate lyase
LIGDVGKKLHTARSRNDQVVTTFKMYVKDELEEVDNLLKNLQGALIEQADLHIDSAMPGFTHLQIAQPIILAHHLLAYVEMFGRDRERVTDALNRMNKSPLGAAALAGTSFPIDSKKTSKLLGFSEPMENSMDAVSDRDFVFDSLSLASIVMVHLSRLSEEIILWSSPGFGFVELPESFSTGSSIMPQKKNPDSAELIRGKTGRISSAFFNVLTMMKGLPLAYFKDMQEDKEAFFDAYDNLFKCLKVAEGLMRALKFKPEAMKKMLTLGHITATDLADWLVKDFNIPFREAHSITGKIVNLAEKKNIKLEDLKLNELKIIDKRISNKVFEVLSLDSSLKSKKSLGGTAPILVKKALSKAKNKWLGR